MWGIRLSDGIAPLLPSPGRRLPTQHCEARLGARSTNGVESSAHRTASARPRSHPSPAVSRQLPLGRSSPRNADPSRAAEHRVYRPKDHARHVRWQSRSGISDRSCLGRDGQFRERLGLQAGARLRANPARLSRQLAAHRSTERYRARRVGRPGRCGSPPSSVNIWRTTPALPLRNCLRLVRHCQFLCLAVLH